MKGEKGGRGSALMGIRSLALSAVLVFALSFAIAWPLWSIATNNRSVFNLLAAVAAALVLIAFVVRRIYRGGAHGRGRMRRP